MGRQRKMSNDEAEIALNKRLDSSGKKEELKEKLLDQLNETGWRDQVALLFKNS